MIKNIAVGIVLIIIGVGAFFLIQKSSLPPEMPTLESTPQTVVPEVETATEVVDETVQVPPIDETRTVIGTSVEGRDITAYHFGVGDTEILFVGGIHGGYEWNTSLVAYELMDYLEENSDSLPKDVTVTVIPVLNPDGLFKVTGSDEKFKSSDITMTESQTIPGRFNANNVDLNRNFNCDWQEQGVWRNTKVSGGSSAFSEPESRAIKSYVESHVLDAVVVWYSAAGGVFASNCHGDVLPQTQKITNLYAKASGYPAHESFDFYTVTGDMVNWLAKNNIPAISVLLTSHTDTEWDKNKAGIDAILKQYAE
ncbi:MAG: hypothetical protein K9M10_01755 [Candidatus Pacebacteria bacterium]|nr:hypothetical protein [Candidatus Paceibacterota bacterium]MCF7857188.1 hypothetical protein [Candidatus Paceibacterota bacterium]